MISAVEAIKTAKQEDHTIWFYAGSFVFWKGHTAASLGEDWDRCEVQGHGGFPQVTIRVEGETSSRKYPRIHAMREMQELACLLDAAHKAGRQYQAKEIRNTIGWTGRV